MTGKLIAPLKYHAGRDFSEGLASVMSGAENGYQWGAIDRDGNVVIPFKYDDLGSFHDGLAYISIKEFKYGYIDKTGKVVVPY